MPQPLHHHRSPRIVVAMKIVLVAIPIALFFVLVNDKLFFTPTLSFSYRPGQATSVGPTGAVFATLARTSDHPPRWRITTDSFPFHVIVPRLIQSVRVQVRLTRGTAPYIGFQTKSNANGNYSVIASSAFLDKLGWKHVTEGPTTLWMRDKHVGNKKVTVGTGRRAKTVTVATEWPVRQYSSVQDFRLDVPSLDLVATANLDHLALASIPDYRPRAAPTRIDHTFRGSHRLYVFASNEDLHLSFEKRDLNQQAGADALTVFVAKADQLTLYPPTWIKTVTVPDDGNAGTNGVPGPMQHVSLDIPGLGTGVYLVDIVTSQDVVFSRLVSSAHYLAFLGNVTLAEGPDYGQTSLNRVRLLTNGSVLNITDVHAQKKQDVAINGQKLSERERTTSPVASGLTGTTTIDIAIGDVVVSTDRLITVAPAELIPDQTHSLDLSGTPDLAPYDYLLAEYRPESSDQVLIDQTYQIDDLALAKKTISFSIESPGLKAGNGQIGFEDIRVTLNRGPFPWDKIRKKIMHSTLGG
ncbi:MAG: hypothetical protein HY092_01250 [Candidatus Kerfeldbacteria bacterium]|nr:hypothetical protein [Candidatus Kerfeldbacteria bacterium]